MKAKTSKPNLKKATSTIKKDVKKVAAKGEKMAKTMAKPIAKAASKTKAEAKTMAHKVKDGTEKLMPHRHHNHKGKGNTYNDVAKAFGVKVAAEPKRHSPVATAVKVGMFAALAIGLKKMFSSK